MKNRFLLLPLLTLAIAAVNAEDDINDITAPTDNSIRIFNFRALGSPNPSTDIKNYNNLFTILNKATTSKKSYDFIALEAYHMNVPGVPVPQSGIMKEALKNAFPNELPIPSYTIIGRPRDNNTGDSEANAIAYNNKKWKLIEDYDINKQIAYRCSKITVDAKPIPQSFSANNEIGDTLVDGAHTCQMAVYGTGYPNDKFQTYGPYARTVTWGVFEEKDKPNPRHVIYVVTHFPLGGQGDQSGYDNNYATIIYTDIILPLRQIYPDAPVIFSGDFNNGHAQHFAQMLEDKSHPLASQTFGEGALQNCDDMVKINFLQSYDGHKINLDNTYSKMVFNGIFNSDVIAQHHNCAPDVTFNIVPPKLQSNGEETLAD